MVFFCSTFFSSIRNCGRNSSDNDADDQDNINSRSVVFDEEVKGDSNKVGTHDDYQSTIGGGTVMMMTPTPTPTTTTTTKTDDFVKMTGDTSTVLFSPGLLSPPPYQASKQEERRSPTLLEYANSNEENECNDLMLEATHPPTPRVILNNDNDKIAPKDYILQNTSSLLLQVSNNILSNNNNNGNNSSNKNRSSLFTTLPSSYNHNSYNNKNMQPTKKSPVASAPRMNSSSTTSSSPRATTTMPTYEDSLLTTNSLTSMSWGNSSFDDENNASSNWILGL